MARTARAQNLLLRGRIYYFRISVPKALAPVFQKREYKKSLGTGDFKLACRASSRYSLAIHSFFDCIAAMKPTRDDINFLIRNHFEKCLMEAEDSRWALHAAVKEGQEDESDVLSNIARLQEDYSRLKQSAKLQGFNREHEEIAAELLNWRELEFSRLGELFRDLAQGVMDAQLEAKRLQIAHMERDEQGMNILPDFLKPCKNYLQYPDFDAFWEYRDTPYHGMAKENKGITLEEAANLYFEEKQKETKSWHQSHRVFIGRLQEFLGADTY